MGVYRSHYFRNFIRLGDLRCTKEKVNGLISFFLKFGKVSGRVVLTLPCGSNLNWGIPLFFKKSLLPYEFPGRRPNFFYSPWLDEKKINGRIRINLTNGGFTIIFRLILKGRFIRRGLCLQFLSRQALLGMS